MKFIQYFKKGKTLLTHPLSLEAIQATEKELSKDKNWVDVVNLLLQTFKDPSGSFLHLGPQRTLKEYESIATENKTWVCDSSGKGVQPTFQMGTDAFFQSLRNNELLSNEEVKWDVIVIDGEKSAWKAHKDLTNALGFLADDGFILLRDCNPLSEWHAREMGEFTSTPAGTQWNGSTWKAFVHWRQKKELFSCCVDVDWGIGVFSKRHAFGRPLMELNPFFEYKELAKKRKHILNLKSFDEFSWLVNALKSL